MRKTDKSLQQNNEDYYRRLVQDANSIILRMDTDGRITFLNKFAQKFFGFKEKEILGKSVLGTIVPITDSAGKNLIIMIGDIVRNPDEYISNENENMLCGGERVWISWTNKALTNKKGHATEILCIGNDITKIKKAEELLKQMDKRKSDFVANVSHEIKNPLFNIREVIDIILKEKHGILNAEGKKLLGYAMKDAARLLRMVHNLLDLSRIESGKIELKKEQLDLATLTNQIIASHAPELSKKNLTVQKEISGNTGTVWADMDNITEVIINLLDNAIKYSPDNSEIKIMVGGNDKEARFEILNYGSGIAEENYKKIFDKFERIITGNQDGAGLGLPIANDIIRLHKGKLWVESALGKWSKFIFTLPRGLNSV